MSRFLDTALGRHHSERIEAPQPYSAPHAVTVRWKPAIAAARGESAAYEGIIMVLRSGKPEAVRLYDMRGLVAKLDSREIAEITERY